MKLSSDLIKGLYNNLSKSQKVVFIKELTSKEQELMTELLENKTERIEAFQTKDYEIIYRELLNHLAQHETNQSNSSNVYTAFRKLNTEYAAFNTMVSLTFDNHVTEYLAKSIIEKCMSLNHYELSISPIQYLIIHYYNYNPNYKLANKYESLLEKQLRINKIEIRSKLLLAKFLNNYATKISPDETVILAKDYLNEIEPFIHEVQSTYIIRAVYLIKIFMYYALAEYGKMEQSAKKAINHLKTFKYRRIELENDFRRKLVEALYLQRKFDLIPSKISDILDNTKKGTTAWFNTQYLLITFYLQTEKYEQAQLVFTQSTNNNSLKSSLPRIQLLWGIIEAYINFLYNIGAIRIESKISRYRINRFINSTTEYQKDKKGINIQLIIAQLLFHITDKCFDKIEEKIQSLEKYSSRYLRHANLYRSRIFIKMLLELPKQNFHKTAIDRHTNKFNNKLKENPIEFDSSRIDIEIIPYEKLWILIVEYLIKD